MPLGSLYATISNALGGNTMIYALKTISYIPLIMASIYMIQEIRDWHILKVTHMTYLAWAILIYSAMQIVIVFLEVWIP